MTKRELDDKIDAWHNSDSKLQLWEYLGWTKDSYATWVETGYHYSLVEKESSFIDFLIVIFIVVMIFLIGFWMATMGG